MLVNGMVVYQVNGLYYFFTQQGELKAQVYLPADGQMLADFKTIEVVAKALAYRWGILRPTKNSK